MYQTSFFIPFYSADPSDILFYGQVFSITHQAYEQMIKDRVCSWPEWFQNPDWVVPMKHTEATYLLPIQPGQECLIKVNLAEIRTSSFTLEFELSQQERLCCRVKAVHVFCTKANFQKQAIPSQIKASLQALI